MFCFVNAFEGFHDIIVHNHNKFLHIKLKLTTKSRNNNKKSIRFKEIIVNKFAIQGTKAKQNQQNLQL